MIPEVGQRFGPYEILGRLGGGGMGLVFRAWDARLHREVAVKLLHDDYKMPAMRERFLLEARAASALNHPNICTIFDIGDQDGNPYLVMELLQGETLKSRIARSALPLEDIVRYGQEIADALTAANAKGIVHRDIKPANIFLVNMPHGKCQAKVLDFGLAKIGLSANGGWGSRTLDLTLAGGTVGTLAYMSPEQGRGESLDTRSDLFALGIVMYEMATRQTPFRGTTSAQMFQQLFNQAPEPVRNWNESIPRHLEKVILKLLAKDRRDRYQTAKELHEALGTIVVKKGLTGWLNKKGIPAVPLLRASDPVARPKPPMRGSATEAAVATPIPDLDSILGSNSDSDAWPIAPAARVPVRDRGGLEKVALSPARHSAVAESDSSSGKFAAARALADQAEERRSRARVRLESSSSHAEAGHLEGGVAQLEAYPFFEQETATEPDVMTELENRLRTRRVKRAIEIAAALAVMLTGIFLLEREGHFRPVVLGPRDGLLLTVIQNKTGDKTLDDGTVMQGLEIELRQADKLKVFGGDAYQAGLRLIGTEGGKTSAAAPVERVAQTVGAKDYLYGEVTRSGASYTISVEVLDTNSNDKVVSLEETAKRPEQIPAAIGRLAQEIRAEVSEGGWARARQSVPLAQEATENVGALHEYALAETAMHSGRALDALTSYRQAVALDPKFIEAQMELAWLYRAQRAEVAAANAAWLAQDAAAHSSDRVRLLARFCYLINVNGDYEQARRSIRQYVARNPHDSRGLAALARVSRLQGYLPEALLAAQQSYGENPFDADAYDEAELALIGMDRYDGALQVEAQARRAGVGSDANILAAAYLSGKTDVVAQQRSAMHAAVYDATAPSSQAVDAQLAAYALYLDNTGQLSAGEAVWRAAAARTNSIPEMASAQAALLARAALNRALVESCNAALQLANEVSGMERGAVASFDAGMAAALCGDKPYAERAIVELKQNFPQNVAVAQYYGPQLEAAADIGINEPASALQLLVGVGEYDQISLAPYLRGLAHAAVNQMPVAVVDFQAVLNHRGVAYMLGSDVYPMAEIDVARASWTSHDKESSANAYIKFLSLWPQADRNDPLVKEALTRTKAQAR